MKGFTLIELLVVVLIIGILSAVAVPQYRRAVNKTRGTMLMALMLQIYNSQEVYFAANGTYASSPDDLDVSLPAGGRPNANGCLTYPNFTCCLCADKLNGNCIAQSCTLANRALMLGLYYQNTPHHGLFVCSDPFIGQNTQEVKPLCNSLGFVHDFGDSRWYKYLTK